MTHVSAGESDREFRLTCIHMANASQSGMELSPNLGSPASGLIADNAFFPFQHGWAARRRGLPRDAVDRADRPFAKAHASAFTDANREAPYWSALIRVDESPDSTGPNKAPLQAWSA